MVNIGQEDPLDDQKVQERDKNNHIKVIASSIYSSCKGNRALLLFLVLLVIYNVTLMIEFSNDVTPNMYLPISMIKHGSITFNHFPELLSSGTPYYLYLYQGNYYSAYGLGTSILAIPFYLPVLLFRGTPSFLTLLYLSKFVAAFYVALSAALLYAAMRRLTREKWALIITIIYALLTPSFCTSSQGLWQQAPSQFLISLAIYFLIRGEEDPRYTALAALPLGFSVLVRTNNLVVVIPFFLYIIWKKRSQTAFFVLWLLPGALVTALYNHIACGAFYTFPIMARLKYLPVEVHPSIPESAGAWNTPFLKGFFGNLVSPSRGLFIISPILLVALFGLICIMARKNGQQRRNRYLYYCFALCFLFQLLLISKWTSWTGGLSFGNRLLIDTLPFICILFIPAFDFYASIEKVPVRQVLRISFAVLLILSALIQVEGIVSYDGGSWGIFGEPSEEKAWDFKGNQIFFYIDNPEPVIPPIIKKATGEPARLSSLMLVTDCEVPFIHFHLSELSNIKWRMVANDSNRTFDILSHDFPKGENTLEITDESLTIIAEANGYRGDISSLKEIFFYSSTHILEVEDPLTRISKEFYLELTDR